MASINRATRFASHFTLVAIAILLILFVISYPEKAPVGARREARIVANCENLKSIHAAILSYQRDNSQQFPLSLNKLVGLGYLDQASLIDNFSGKELCGYRLIAPNKKLECKKDSVLVIQLKHNVGDPYFILKLDGTVEAFDEPISRPTPLRSH